jgi:hypothetical protein
MALEARFFQQIARCQVAGEEDNSALRQNLHEFDRQINAILSRHDDVSEDDVWLDPFRPLQGVACVGHPESLKALVLQDLKYCFPDHRLVIDYHDDNLPSDFIHILVT